MAAGETAEAEQVAGGRGQGAGSREEGRWRAAREGVREKLEEDGGICSCRKSTHSIKCL